MLYAGDPSFEKQLESLPQNALHDILQLLGATDSAHLASSSKKLRLLVCGQVTHVHAATRCFDVLRAAKVYPRASTLVFSEHPLSAFAYSAIVECLNRLPDNPTITHVKIGLYWYHPKYPDSFYDDDCDDAYGEILNALTAATERRVLKRLPGVTATMCFWFGTAGLAVRAVRWLPLVKRGRGLQLVLNSAAIPAELQQALRGLQGLTIYSEDADVDLSFLSSIAPLTRLELEYWQSAAQVLLPVVFQLTRLQELTLKPATGYSGPFAMPVWQQLPQLQRLRFFRADDTTCGAAGLDALAQLPELEELELHTLDLAAESEVPELQQLLRFKVSG